MEREMAETAAIRKISSILDEINQMQDRIMRRAYDIFERNGRVFGRDLDHWLQAEKELLWKPALELREANGEFVLEAAVSGVDPKDLEIEVTPEDIVLKADIQHEHEEKKGAVHICEFQSGRMFRSIHLPKRINPDKVKVEIQNGLLMLTAEIAEEARAKKIKPEAA
jgi:HSP20 family protein